MSVRGYLLGRHAFSIGKVRMKAINGSGSPRIGIPFLILALLLVHTYDAHASLLQKRVLVLYSEEKDHPAHELTDHGIRATFQSSKLFKVQVYTEYLDISRFAGLSHARTMADYLRRKYSGIKIDAIITVYPAAVDFLQGKGFDVFPGTPIVANAVIRNYAEKLKHSPPHRSLTGTIVGENAAGVINTALRIRPDSKRVALIGGTSPNDLYALQIFRKALEPHLKRIELIDLTGLPMEATLTRVGSLPPDTIVLYGSISRDGEGRTFVPREALLDISRVSNAPVFGLYDSYMGFGIVGGRLVSWEQLGREAAAVALRIMGGESPAAIPFGGEQAYITAFDWRELKRWKIPETVLPAGAEIRYRIPTFWEEHRIAIVGAASVIVVETFLVVGLLFNIRRRRRAERSLRESEDRVRLAVSSAGAGLWSLDLDSGEIWSTNRARELFGFAQEEPMDYERMLSHIYSGDRNEVRLMLEQAAKSGEETVFEYRVSLPDGNVRWIAYRGRLQQNLPGNLKRLIGTSIDVTKRKLAEETLKQREVELVTLTRRLIHSQEEEMRRLSRDLHDDLTQRLAVLAIDAGMLEKALRSLHPQASQEITDLKKKLIEVSDEVHNLSRQLHPSILDDLGLVQAIQSECETFSRRTGIAVSFEPGNPSISIPRDIALCLYRVLQEGLQNISKHSGASEARIVLQDYPDGLRLSIQDPGIGFDLKQVAGKGAIGLSSMRERVSLANGTLSVVSERGKGTEIQVFIPPGGRHV
jgi:PAS domain S-box-containing protein